MMKTRTILNRTQNLRQHVGQLTVMEMDLPRLSALLLLLVVCSASPAAAQDKQATVTTDSLQQQYEKQLLLRQRPNENKSNMAPDVFQFLLLAVEQKRFDVQDWEPASQDVLNWCVSGAAQAQSHTGDLGNKGEARVDLESIRKRCSEVAQFAFSASHKCAQSGGKWTCSVNVEIELVKYTAKATAGTVRLVVDEQFGRQGRLTIKSSGSGTDDHAETLALMKAAFVAKLFAERKVRDIPYFQIRAPIVRHSSSKTYHCLSGDVGELDMPMYVLKRTPDGVERVGFVKCRQYFDGCVLTPDMEERKKKGGTVRLEPSWAQDILGSGNIKEGMTVWEMPSVGLNLGLGGGISQIAGGGIAPTGQLTAEYNLARHIGISELHASVHLRGTFYMSGAADKLGDRFLDAYGFKPGDNPGVAEQAEVGLTKRWYMDSPLFFDLGLYAASSYYHFASVSILGHPYDMSLQTAGAAAKAGFGFQLAPRWLLRLLFGYRYAVPMVEVKDSQGRELVPFNGANLDDFGAEQGIVGTLDLMYTM